MGFCEILTFLLLVAKIFAFINVGWLVVFLPVIIKYILIFLIFIIASLK